MDVKSGQARQTGLLNRPKGMTLLEVVLALALSSLFFCCLLDLTGRGISLHQRMQEEARLIRQMNYMRLFIQDQFDQAKKVSFYDQNNALIYTNERTSDLNIEEEKNFKKIVFNEKEILKISKERKNDNELFKMTYAGKTLNENIQNITVVQRGDWIFLTCTLVGRGNIALTEEILLNTVYKK